MGQQQLLLIALGTIVVGIAVAVGMNQFSSSAVEANRDRLIMDLNFLSVSAQAYYKKQVEFGGGNNSFKDWELPDFYNDYENGNIKVVFIKNGDELKLTATGTEIGIDGEKVKIRADVTSTSFNIKILN
jgi:hypothetical protein